MALRKLIIIGAGGFGREVLAWSRQSAAFDRDWTIAGFLDDNELALNGKNTPAPWLGRISDHQPATDEVFVCAIGIPGIRRKCVETIVSRGGELVNVIHPTVVFADNVALGRGIILCPYVILSANTALGDGVAVNLHSSVDHDAQVGAWSQINCHCDLTGGVVLGEEVFMGSHSSVLPGVKVGDRVVIGAGAVVLKDVPPGLTVAGVPARPLRLE